MIRFKYTVSNKSTRTESIKQIRSGRFHSWYLLWTTYFDIMIFYRSCTIDLLACKASLQLPIGHVDENCSLSANIFDRSQHFDLPLSYSSSQRAWTFKKLLIWVLREQGKNQLGWWYIRWGAARSNKGWGAALVVGGKHGFGHPWHLPPLLSH